MIKFLDLQKISQNYSNEIHEAVHRVIDSGWYLQGSENRQFEKLYAAYIGTQFCIGVGNGLDSLRLILQGYKELGVMKEGDEIIVPANTYIATILSICENNLIPVLIEPELRTLQIDIRAIERAITPKTRGIMIVHLYGRCAYDDSLADLCKRYHLKLIEDNAQAQGCMFNEKKTGSLGDASGHSFYPGKNLGALGDAGAITTNDPNLAATVRCLGNYGSAKKYYSDYQGINSRLDELQAAVLCVKLPHLDKDNGHRKRIAKFYLEKIQNINVVLPEVGNLNEHVFHVFPVLSSRRDELQAYLTDHNIQTLIHYPIPPHKQKCFSAWNNYSFPITEKIHREELSLPISPVMTDWEVEQVVKIINEFH